MARIPVAYGDKMEHIEVKRAIAIQHILSHMMNADTVSLVSISPERHDDTEEQSPPIQPRLSTRTPSPTMRAESAPTDDIPKIVKRKTYGVGDIVKIWKSVFPDTMEGTCKLCDESRISLETRSGADAWEVSHVIPHRDGGSERIENLRPLCRSCNRSMGKTEFKAFAFQQYPERFDEIITIFNLE